VLVRGLMNYYGCFKKESMGAGEIKDEIIPFLEGNMEKGKKTKKFF
jgi:hypothetical protein